nr:hypothetical protein [uncultured Desulfobacter sp.]
MAFRYSSSRIDRLLEYNKNLERQLDLLQLNERVIEKNLEELGSLLCVSDRIEQYSICRLTEMALFCVGNYANNNCVTEVGDFLMNPRLILVHIKGCTRPVIKERYTPLSVQFKDRGAENYSVGEWLRHNTMTEIVKKPILPYLLELLEIHNCQKAYIDSVKKRVNDIVDLLTHLSIYSRMNIEAWKSTLEEDDRKMMERLFYKFDYKIFNDFGKKIQKCSDYCVAV